MHPRPRTLVCLVLTAIMLVGALPRPTLAQSPLLLEKHLIDGEWQSGQVMPEHPLALSTEAGAIGQAAPADSSYDTGKWKRYVYTSYRDGNEDIFLYTGTPEGTLTMNLTHHRAVDTHPRLNHTANQVVFVSERDRNPEIYSMRADGTAVRRLTVAPADDIQPFWSPDSRAIVFASARDGNWNLYRMNADGTGLARLTTSSAADLMPAWSPDGRTIAWVRAGATDGVLWLMNADGTNQRAITGPLRYLQHPAWSPDGSQLAVDYDRNGDGFNDLVVMNANGSGAQTIPIRYSLAQPGQRIDVANASWAPPGDWLVNTIYVYNLSGNKATFVNSYIGLATLDGSNSGAVVWPATFDRYPDLQSLDLIAPRSSLARLPAWTRGNKVNVSWDGSDAGVSDSFSFDVQYRIGTGPWVDWKMHTGDTGDWQADYAGAPGDTVTFRVRARDVAGNTEPWHSANGDTFTTFFNTFAQGQLTDNRAVPLADAKLNLSPAAIAPASTGADGRFMARLVDSAAHAITPSASGYLSPPATTLPSGHDHTFNPYLLPSDNQVQNGGFEVANRFDNWSVSGTLPAVVTSTVSLSGQKAAQLGQICVAACLSAAELIPTESTAFAPSVGIVAVDQANTVHILWSKPEIDGWKDVERVYHQTRSAAGAWSAPEYIGDGSAIGLIIDRQQTLHTALATPSGQLTYRRRPSGGSWSVPQAIGLANFGNMWIDQHDRIYFLYTCPFLTNCPNRSEATYRIRATDGTWSPAHTLPSDDSQLAIGPDDSAYAVWQLGGRGFFAKLQPDGSTTAPIRFDNDYQVSRPQAVIDSAGTAHIIWTLNSALYYVALPAHGEAPLPTKLSQGGGRSSLLEAGGILYLINNNDRVGYDPTLQYGIHLRWKTPASDWSPPALLFATSYSNFGIASDTSGRIHLVRTGPYRDPNRDSYYQTIQPAGAASAALKQTITIPANLHKPTLAFSYALGGVVPISGSQLEVTITQAAQTTSAFSSAAGAGWSLASIDMQPWAGKTVDLNITLHQASGAPNAIALIDDVSLGSWLTPVIEQMAPATIAKPSIPTQMTISGENFLSPPTVRLGAHQLTGVQLIDEHTIKVTIPAGLAPGRYDLRVGNPGGQTALRPGIVVGKLVYLPATLR